jgi:hypothetical protein
MITAYAHLLSTCFDTLNHSRSVYQLCSGQVVKLHRTTSPSPVIIPIKAAYPCLKQSSIVAWKTTPADLQPSLDRVTPKETASPMNTHARDSHNGWLTCQKASSLVLIRSKPPIGCSTRELGPASGACRQPPKPDATHHATEGI